MTPSPTTTSPRQRIFVLLFVLLALVLRVIYVPLHLTQESHLGEARLPFSHAEHTGEHSHHEHDEDHVPHEALDHECELIEERTAALDTHFEPLALPLEEACTLSMSSALSIAAQPEPRPPDSLPRDATRPRGPPAIS